MAKNLTHKVNQQTRTHYPFADMQVGDFFYCNEEDDGTRQKVRAAAHNHSKKNGIILSTKYDGKKIKVVRVE